MNVGSIQIPDKLMEVAHKFKTSGRTFGGVSGGRTSGLMHILSLAVNSDADYTALFANTGKEHDKTLVFLDNIQKHTGRPLVWLEFQKPETFGARPRESGFKVVDFESANRAGVPFVEFLEMLEEYRRVQKDEGPVAPHASMRICTAYMKVKVQHKYALSFEPSGYDKFVGLRADEPDRVRSLMNANTKKVESFCPLYDAGITKQDVLDFWKTQPFDLDIPEHLGNCNKCFLKDHADISQSYYEEPWDGQWWLDLQDRFGDFKRGDVSMRQLFSEAPVRLEVVRPAVMSGVIPECPQGFDPYRFKLIVRNEQRILKEGKKAFSCSCEAAQGFDDDSDQLPLFPLWRAA